jgi:lysophospholipase L1-like esterase
MLLPAGNGMTTGRPAAAARKLPAWKLALFRLLACSIGVLLCLTILEFGLRLYPPAALRIRGGRIALPLNQRTQIHNSAISKADRVIVQTRNALGFRGADPPSDLAQRLSLVTVGGSTTECYYLSDERTWPEQLRSRLDERFHDVWLNNAGLDGHSTYGHQRLLDQYLDALRPKCIVFLVALNDIGLDRSREFDERLARNSGASGRLPQSYFWIVEHSATAALFDNIRRTRQARAAGVTHQNIDHAQLQLDEARPVEVSEADRAEVLQLHRERFLPAYRARLQQLIESTREMAALPVLVTQPALCGPARDPETGFDLGRVAIGNVNGEVQWEILELYNSVTRDVCRERDAPLIELAELLPKDSRLYYDYYHFTNQGAEKVAEIVANELTPILSRTFPSYVR